MAAGRATNVLKGLRRLRSHPGDFPRLPVVGHGRPTSSSELWRAAHADHARERRIAVHDLEAAIAFFTDLGLTVSGLDTVSGEWTDTAVGPDGNHAKIATLQTPDGKGRVELLDYIHPDAIETAPTLPHESGMHRVASSVGDLDEALEVAVRHGCHPLRGVATYEDRYTLT